MGFLDKARRNKEIEQIKTNNDHHNGIATLSTEKTKSLNETLIKHFSKYMIDATMEPTNDHLAVITEILHTGNHKLTQAERDAGDPELSPIRDELNRIEPQLLADKQMARRVAADVVGFGAVQQILGKYPDATDIGYDGRFLTVETNTRKFIYGVNKKRLSEEFLYDQKTKKARIQVTDDDIIQIAQRFALHENKNFSEADPIFNGFSSNFRISATYPNLSPNGPTMSIRVSRPRLALTEGNFNNFAPLWVYEFLSKMILSRANVMISGETGTGKTELLKLLVKSIPFSQRIIMIEDVAETQLATLYPEKEIYDWLTRAPEKDSGKDSKSEITISDMVKDALRNNPSWLMVSETRGKEAYEMFQAVLSGHSLITTLHSISNEAVPSRFVGMSSMIGDIDTDMLRSDFLRYMNLGIHITKRTFADGRVLRYMDELSEFTPDPKHNGIRPLFKQRVELDPNTNKIYRYYNSYSLSEQTVALMRDKANINNTDFWAQNIHPDVEYQDEIMKDTAIRR